MVHFPNEIWLGVAGYLELPSDVCTRKYETVSEDEEVTQQTLINLCLVSKQLCAIFQPHLYGNFIKRRRPAAKHRLLKSDSEWLHKYYQQDERSLRATRKQTRLENFIITMIHRPDLAAKVKHLRIGWFSESSALPRPFQGLYKMIPLHETTSSLFAHALRSFKGFDRLRNHFKRSWEEDLKKGDEGAEVAFLLTLLPSLESLRLEAKTGSINLFVQELCNTMLGSHPKSWTLVHERGVLCKRPSTVQSNQQPPDILPVLTSLNIWSYGGLQIPWQNYESLLSLPCLDSFRGRGLNLHRNSRQFGLSSLQHLQLVRCKTTNFNLQNLLGDCTRLRSLEVNTKYAFDPRDMGTITIHTMQLAQTADTLESLTLMMPEYDISVPLDLRSFNKLRHLQVDMDFLSYSSSGSKLHEMLSTRIETLIVRRAHTEIKPHLEKLLDTFETSRRFSNLLTIKLYALKDDYKELRIKLDDSRKRAQGLQVALKIKKEPYHNHEWWWYDNSDIDSDTDLDQEGDSDDEDEDSEDENWDHEESADDNSEDGNWDYEESADDNSDGED